MIDVLKVRQAPFSPRQDLWALDLCGGWANQPTSGCTINHCTLLQLPPFALRAFHFEQAIRSAVTLSVGLLSFMESKQGLSVLLSLE